MRGPTPFDEDAVLSGELDPASLPPALRRVAELVRAARAGATPAEQADDAGVIAAVAELARDGVATPTLRRHRIRRLALVKGGAVAAAVLVGGGAAAAATGALPTPVQRAVARGLKVVGVSVPDPPSTPPTHSVPPSAARAAHPTTPTFATSSTTATHTTTGAAATPARAVVRGWCVADERPAGTHSVGLARDLAAAAKDAQESVKTLCSGLVTHWSERAASHPTTSTAAPATVTPSTPAHGAPAGTAPGQEKSPGSATHAGGAPGRSSSVGHGTKSHGTPVTHATNAKASGKKGAGTATSGVAASGQTRKNSAQGATETRGATAKGKVHRGGVHPAVHRTARTRAHPARPNKKIAHHVVTTTTASTTATATAPVGPLSGNSASHGHGGASAVVGRGGATGG